MEEINKEDRLNQIKKLDDFLESSNSMINDLLLKLNFTREDVFEEQNKYKTCPIDKSHKVSLKHYDKHVERCTTNKKRPERDEEMELPTGDLYDGRIPSVKIDKNLQYEIIKNALEKNPIMKTGVPIDKLQERELPRYHSDIQVDFSREEKLALYEYSVEKTGHHPEPEIKIPFNEDETGKKTMTFAEIVAYKRDIKRRRMKYRTTKEPPLSRTEEVRRLIDTQMEALIQYLRPEEEKKEIQIPSCSKSSQMKKMLSPEKLYSSSGSSRRTFDYNREKESDYNRKMYKRSRSRSRSRMEEKRVDTPRCSKSTQRKKSMSPASKTYIRNDSKSHRKKNKRSRSRSRSQNRDRSSKREHKKSKHKKRERSRSRSRHCDYDKRSNK